MAFNGFKNPNIALQLLFWNHQYYNYAVIPTSNAQTIYEELYLGRYAWVYIVAPFVGAFAAGVLAKAHLNNVAAVKG